jgi:hypothetical protein
MGVAEYVAEGNDVSTIRPTMIGLGRLVDLIIRDTQGQRLRITPRDERWLAWRSDTLDLVVLRPRRGEGAVAKRGDARRHQMFHGAKPEQARPMEWPAPHGVPRMFGLIESVTYTAAGIRSPTKGLHHWVHQFGDRGESGHGKVRINSPSRHTERFMPGLEVCSAGNLFVVRRSDNIFTVRDWIIG